MHGLAYRGGFAYLRDKLYKGASVKEGSQNPPGTALLRHRTPKLA